MKQYFPLIISLFLPAFAIQAQLQFDGNTAQVVTVTPPAATGIEAIYVLPQTYGVKAGYTGASSVKWSRFGSDGAAYAKELGVMQTITLDAADAGYIAEVNGRQHYFWIVNYADHTFEANSLSPDPEQSDYQHTLLSFSGNAAPINYYSITGRVQELDRRISLSYNSLAYDADAAAFTPVTVEKSFSSIKSTLTVDAPLCDTRFVLSGDCFLAAWGNPSQIESSLMTATAVAAETSATQTERDVDNEQQVIGAALGGSAPCEISFSAVTTDAASFTEWQLASNSQFDPIDDRYNQTELTYTFRDQGTTYVRFFAANAAGECEYYSPVYEVSIGESALLCPNAFSPQSSPGVNDEWKVSYKSIVSFDCHIFNRWGTEVCAFTDPAKGWDGKYNGKYVPAGTYYYVIKARGADGKDYKLSGDINIIGSKNINSTSGSYD